MDPGARPICAGPDPGLDPHHQAADTSRPPGEPGDRPAQVSLCPYEDTRACTPYDQAAGPAGDTSTARWFTRTAGTGSVPSRNHRYAVCG